jgi:FixJ family two-component response regulator
VGFLPKPLNEEVLLRAVGQAVASSRAKHEKESAIAHLKRQYASLTPRQVEVLGLVVAGKLNRQVAAELGVSEKTVKIYRARIMQKLQVHSVAELVWLYQKVGLPSAEPS